MFSNLGSGEILIIVLVLFFLFGSKKLPELARGLGESGKELKKAKKEIESALSDITTDEKDQKKSPPSREGSTKGGESN